MVGALRTYSVAAAEAGERLDKFLVQRDPELGRRGARWLLEHGLVKVDGRIARKSQRVETGNTIEVLGEWAAAPLPEPDAPLLERLVRPDLVVVEKPAGQATAPLGALAPGSLAAALLGRYPEMAGVGYRAREPGLLHRLDTGTSGLVVAARTALAFECLRAALGEHRLVKRYLAIVAQRGLPDAGLIEQPLMPDPKGSGRVVIASGFEANRAAVHCRTSFTTLERRGPWALVELVAARAYRHQVRVHLASAGWPIAGDARYGGPAAPLLGDRHALHASHVAWAGDERVPAFAVDSPLPDDLRALLDAAAGVEAFPGNTSSSS